MSYYDCEICGEQGVSLNLFAGASHAILCLKHRREFAAFAQASELWKRSKRITGQSIIEQTLAQGGQDTRKAMERLVEESEEMRHQLEDIAVQWLADTRAEYRKEQS